MATYSFHIHVLLIGKLKIDNFSCLNGDIWNLFLQKCLLSSPLSFICLLYKLLNLFEPQRDKTSLRTFGHQCGKTVQKRENHVIWVFKITLYLYA